MCKTWSVTYTCKHSCLFRLSTCRGTFLQPGHSECDKIPMVGCCSAPCLVFRSKQACGECQRAMAEHHLRKNIEATRQHFISIESGLQHSFDLELAGDEHFSNEWQLERLYPVTRLKKYLCPEQKQLTTQLPRPGTVLRQEVLPDEVILQPEAGWAETAGTGVSYMSLEEELAEAEIDEPEEVRECEAECEALMQNLGSYEVEDKEAEDSIEEMWWQWDEVVGNENPVMNIGQGKASEWNQGSNQPYPIIESEFVKSAATEMVVAVPLTCETNNDNPNVIETVPHLSRRREMTDSRSKISKQADTTSGCSSEDLVKYFRSSLAVA